MGIVLEFCVGSLLLIVVSLGAVALAFWLESSATVRSALTQLLGDTRVEKQSK
jgi:hypothetical protein